MNRFKSKVNLKDVMARYAKLSPVARGYSADVISHCPKCGKRFSNLGSMQAHAKNCKGIENPARIASPTPIKRIR